MSRRAFGNLNIDNVTERYSFGLDSDWYIFDRPGYHAPLLSSLGDQRTYNITNELRIVLGGDLEPELCHLTRTLLGHP